MVNKIQGSGPLRPTTGPARTAKAGEKSGVPFASLLEETGAAPATTLAAATVAATPLNIAQEVEDSTSRNQRQARERGHHLLDQLDGLRLALLEGQLRPGQIEALSRLVTERRPLVSDPALIEILNEIELRAAVELAKLQRRRP